MRTETELKAAAFDEFMEMAKRDTLSNPFKPSISKQAAALLNCIYESEKACDEITRLVDGEIYRFSFYDIDKISVGLLGVCRRGGGYLEGNGQRYDVGKCKDFVRLIKSPN